MTEHKVGTREEWLETRRELLEREKELTRLSDELANRCGVQLRHTAPSRLADRAGGSRRGGADGL